MSKYNLFSLFIIGLIGGFLIGTNPVYANTRAIGPQPFIPTDIAEGTLFVKPNGSGNSCSKANPCKIQTAINKASAGDVVFLRGGIYKSSRSIKISSSGTPGNPVIYESFPGELAVFDGAQHPNGSWIGVQLTGNFNHIRNIEFKKWPRMGIEIFGSDNVLDGVHSHHNRLAGIKVWAPTGSDETKASRNIIRNCTVHDNSGAGLFEKMYNDGGNSDGIAISYGFDNRVENCLSFHNSDDGIDTWKSQRTYVGYSISHSNGIANGEGNGIKAGGKFPSNGTFVEHTLAYSNKGSGFNFNTGSNVTFSHNTSWSNKKVGYKAGSDTVVTKNITLDEKTKWGAGIETDNSWQHSGNAAFISTDPKSTNFLVPTSGSGFEGIGAFSGATK